MKTREEAMELKRKWLNDPCWDIEKTDGFEDWYTYLYGFRMEQEEKWKAERDAQPINMAKSLIYSDYTGSLVYAVIAIAEELIKLNKLIEEYVDRH